MKKLTLLKKRLGVLFVFLLILSACVKQVFDPEKLSKSLQINPGLAVPIGFSDLTLKEFLEDSARPEMLIEDDDGFLRLVYSENIFSFRSDEVIEFNDISASTNFLNPFPLDLDLNYIPEPIVHEDTLSIDFDFSNSDGNEQIDSIELKTAAMAIKVSSEYELNSEIELIFPNLSFNGTPYSKKLLVNSESQFDDLADYMMVLENSSNQTNSLLMAYELFIDTSEVVVPAGVEMIDIEIEFYDVSFYAIYGYVGQFSIGTEVDTLSLSFYDKAIEGRFHFEDPKITLRTKNTLGVPIGLSVDPFEADTRYNGIETIEGSAIPTLDSPVVINYPSLDQVGEIANDSIVLDVQSTNFFDVLGEVPRYIWYGARGITNPEGDVNQNFVLADSQYEVDMEIELPIWGWTDFLVTQDTIKFDFKDFYNKDIEEIKQLGFILNYTNGFPIEISAQVYFTDENYTILDSIFDDPKLIEGGKDLNGDERVDPIENDPLIVLVDRDKIYNIEHSKHILFWGRINTTHFEEEESYKFYSDYFIKTQLGALVEVETNTANY